MNKVLRPGGGKPRCLHFGEQELIVLGAVLAVAAPSEGCALLLGPAAGDHWLVAAIWPCLNVWQPAKERCRRFALDPREQLQAQRWARSRGWQVHGAAHSHPVGPLEPSPTDRRLTLGPTVMVIAAAAPEAETARVPLRAWWLDQDPRTEPLPLAVLIGEPPSGDDGE